MNEKVQDRSQNIQGKLSANYNLIQFQEFITRPSQTFTHICYYQLSLLFFYSSWCTYGNIVHMFTRNSTQEVHLRAYLVYLNCFNSLAYTGTKIMIDYF